MVIVTSRGGGAAGGAAAVVGGAALVVGAVGAVWSRFGGCEHAVATAAATATRKTRRAHVMGAMYSNALARDVPGAPTRMRNSS
jgi:hypothetical protein